MKCNQWLSRVLRVEQESLSVERVGVEGGGVRGGMGLEERTKQLKRVYISILS